MSGNQKDGSTDPNNDFASLIYDCHEIFVTDSY